MQYRPEVDGLRAVAVLPVILFHGGFTALFGGGFVGVDVFFVISGYLITTIINNEIQSGSFSIRTFYERRARRILPALFFICLFCVPFGWMWLLPGEFEDFSQSLLAITIFSSNILFWLETGYFESLASLKPLLHTWSLSVEEQFYLFFPWLLLAIRKFRNPVTVLIVFGLTTLSLGSAIFGNSRYPTAVFYLIPTRAWELGVGALVALYSPQNWRATRAIAELVSISGMVMIVASVLLFSEDIPFPGMYTLVPVIGAAMVILSATRETIVGRLLSSRIAVGIGLVSYSLYLWHQPVIAFLRLRSLYAPSSTAMLGAIGLTALLSILTWRWIEVPFRNRGLVSRSTLTGTLLLGFGAIVVVGMAGTISHGFPGGSSSRASADALQHRVRPNRGLSSSCEGEFTLSSDCRTGDSPSVVLWGDSYAMHLAGALRAARPDLQMIQMTKSVCGPILGLAPITATFPEPWARGCVQFNQQVLDWLSRSDSVEFVVLSSAFIQYLLPEHQYLTTSGVVAVDAKRLTTEVLSTLRTIEKMGLRPIVVSPPPTMGEDIGRCLVRSHYFESESRKCDFPLATHEARNSQTIALLREIEKHFRVVWLDKEICHTPICAASTGGVFVYRDTGHLSYEGAEYVGANSASLKRALTH